MAAVHDFVVANVGDAEARVGSRATDSRYALDGARGLASLKVMLAHTLYIGEHWSDRNHWWVKYSPMELLLDMRIAVYMFYVLSGYALYAVLDRAGAFSYPRFVAHRLVRICPPLIAACVIAYVLMVVCRNIDRHEPAYFFSLDQNWLMTTLKDAVCTVFLVGNAGGARLDPPLWSLVYEVRGTLLFPFFYFAFTRWTKFVSIMIIIACVSAGIVLTRRQANFSSAENGIDAALFTLFLFFPFFVGAALRRYSREIADAVAPRPWATFLLLAPVYVAFRALRLPVGLAGIARIAFAAMVLICALHITPVRKMLETKALRFFGSISYSLYLTHFLVLYAVVALLSDRAAPFPLAVLSVSGSLLVAILFCFAIERPTHRWAKRIGWRNPSTTTRWMRAGSGR